MSSSEPDPWDWSVDAVVAHLCRPEGSLFPRYESVVNKTDLETAIRNNYLTGDCLLQLSDTQIETRLGISAIGPQIHCRNDVQQLQRRSMKWLEHASQYLTFQQAPTMVPVDSIFANIASMSLKQSSSSTPIPPAPMTASKRITPTLVPPPMSQKSVKDEEEEVNHTVSKDDTQFIELDQDPLTTQAYTWRELMDRVELPQIPEELFSRNRSLNVRNIEGKRTNSTINAEMDRPMEKDSRSEPPPSTNDGYNILKDIEAEQLVRWQATKLPQLELKAHHLWNDAKDKRSMQEHCLQQVKKLEHRLQVLEKEILQSISSLRDVKRVAEILQPTVADIAAWRWKFKLYGRPVQPEKLADQTDARPKKRKLADSDDDDDDDEIDLSSEDWDDLIDDEEDSNGDVCEGDEEDLDEHSGEDENSQSASNQLQLVATNRVTSSKHSTSVVPGISSFATKVKVNNPHGHPSTRTPQKYIKLGTAPDEDTSSPPHWDLKAWKEMGPAHFQHLMATDEQGRLLVRNIRHNLGAWQKVEPFISDENDLSAACDALYQFLNLMLEPITFDRASVRNKNPGAYDASASIAVWYTLWHSMKAITSPGLPRSDIISALTSITTQSGRDDFVKFWRILQVMKRCHASLLKKVQLAQLRLNAPPS